MDELLSWGRNLHHFVHEDDLFNSFEDSSPQVTLPPPRDLDQPDSAAASPTAQDSTLLRLRVLLVQKSDQNEKLLALLEESKREFTQVQSQNMRLKAQLQRGARSSCQNCKDEGQVKELQRTVERLERERRQREVQRERAMLRLPSQERSQQEERIRCLEQMVDERELKIKNLQYQLDIKKEISLTIQEGSPLAPNTKLNYMTLKENRTLDFDRPDKGSRPSCSHKRSRSPVNWFSKLKCEKGWQRCWR